MKNINAIYKENRVYSLQKSDLKIAENLVEGNLTADLIIVYHAEGEKILVEELKDFLMKLLGAAKHTLDNTLIINDLSGIKFKQILSTTQASKLIVFGSTRNHLGLNLNLKRYKTINIQGCECIFVDKLSMLQDDVKRKGALWSLMKTMFNIA